MSVLTPRSRSGRLAAALAAVGLTVSALSGCASAVSEQRTENTSSTPRDGGTLQIATTNDLAPASVFTNSTDTVNVLIGSVYDSLVDYPLDSITPKPKLATSWQQGKDGKSLTLQLRKGVKFHDGRPFTSKDVEFSIRTWADPKWTVQLQRTAAAITGFDTSKPDQITLKFAHPLSNVFDLLDMLPIIDRNSIGDLARGKKYIGTGPFEFKSWQPGSKITLTRNDDYWGGKPHLDGIVDNIVSDPQGQVSQLRSGQVDLVTGASNRDNQTLAKDPRFHVESVKGAEQEIYVGATVTNPLLKDVKVRQAIAYALDRNRILHDVYRGFGRAGSLPWPTTSPAYDAKANHTYDLDLGKAKQLAQQAGVNESIPLAYPAGNANYEATAQIVQQNLADAGIRTTLQPTDYAQFIQLLISGGFKGLWILQHSYAQYTPSTLSVSAYPFNADKNASHYSSPAYTRDANAAWERPDGTDAGAKQVYQSLNKDLLDGAFLLEIGLLYPQFASKASVNGVGFSKRGEPDFAHAYVGK